MPRIKFDTDTIMSSLREMVQAECMVLMASSTEEASQQRAHYSKHETVVREGLKAMGAKINELDQRTARTRVLGGKRGA